MVNGSRPAGHSVHLARATVCPLLLLTIALPLFAQDQTQSPESIKKQQSDDERAVFVMGERPSLRFGDVLRLDLTSKVDLEVRESPDVRLDTVEMGRRRIGVDGRFLGIFGFQVEGDVSDDAQPWRDVFVEMRKWRALRVRAGRFKIPFGQERLTSISDLEFASRSVPTDALAPGRDTGIELNGRVFSRILNYRIGAFRDAGDASRADDGPRGRTAAARVEGALLSWTGSRPLQRIQLGVNVAASDLPEGLNGLRARTHTAYEAFAPVYVAGRRTRVGADAAYEQGPFVLRAEYLQSRDERERQGLLDEDLPDIVARGWHVSATTFVLGRLKSNGTAPRNPLGGGGIGAIQLAGRLESLTFGSGAGSDAALRNPRAANVMPNDFRAVTAGVNWYPVRFVKIQFNVIREHLQDPERRPDVARPWVTSGVLRFQFAL